MKRFRLLAGAVLLAFLSGCGQTPDQTQKARGLLSGVNLIVGLTIIVVVVAVAFIVGAIAFDRFVRTRRQLADAPPVIPEDEEDEVMSGITVGRASVPRWLYACYVLIPVFSLVYVFSNVSVQAERPKGPAKTAKPTGPVTAATVVASGIKFDATELVLKAASPITVTIDNKDTGVPHTFTVWKSEADATAAKASGKIADTGTFSGGTTKKLSFKTGPPGSLYFNCTIHPTSMFGKIQIQ